MKKTENLETFVSLINDMGHRERFIFPANNTVNSKYGETCFVELYNTVLFETKNRDRNITIHLVDEGGNIIDKKARLHKLWTNEFYWSVYSMFQSDVKLEVFA